MKKVYIAVCIFCAMFFCQQIYEAHLRDEQYRNEANRVKMETDIIKNLKEVGGVAVGYNSLTEAAQMEKDINAVADGIIKKAVQEMLARAKTINVPTPMLEDTSFLYSKSKLDAAIQRQNAAIKKYRNEVGAVIDKALDGAAAAAVADCEGKYTSANCAKLKKALDAGFGKAKTDLYRSIPVYIDYVEEELNTMRFISNHYNKFTTSGSFPHFTDTALQNQFMAKVKEIDRKGQAVADLRNNAWKNTRRQINRI